MKRKIIAATLISLAIIGAVAAISYYPNIFKIYADRTVKPQLQTAYDQANDRLGLPFETIGSADTIYDDTNPTASCSAVYPPGVERRGLVCFASQLIQKQYSRERAPFYNTWIDQTVASLRREGWTEARDYDPVKMSDETESKNYSLIKRVDGFECRFQIEAVKYSSLTDQTKPYSLSAYSSCLRKYEL